MGTKIKINKPGETTNGPLCVMAAFVCKPRLVRILNIRSTKYYSLGLFQGNIAQFVRAKRTPYSIIETELFKAKSRGGGY